MGMLIRIAFFLLAFTASASAQFWGTQPPNGPWGPWLVNYKFSQLSHYHTARTGGRARVLFIGDSTTIGFGAGQPDGTNTNEQATSFPTQASQLYVGSNQSSVIGQTLGSGGTDSRLTLNSWTVSGASLGWTSFFTNSSDATSLAFAPTPNITTCDVWYITTPGGGTFTLNFDGGATLATVNTNTTAGIAKQTITAPSSGQHTANAVRSSGANSIVGFECYDTTQPNSVSFINAGAAGSTSTNQVLNTQGWSPLNALGTFAPDLTVIDLGINDMATSIPLTTSQANLQTLITQSKLSGDVILVVPNPISTATASLAIQSAYRQMVISLAASNGIDCIDFQAYFGTQAYANSIGLMSNSAGANHPSALGYSYLAIPVAALLRQ